MSETWEMVMFAVSGVFAFAATIASIALISGHLRSWTVPDQQRHIVRLILMVPIYSVDSWLSVRFREYSLLLDIFRDCYEGYVLYQFFSLLVSYIENGEQNSMSMILSVKPSHGHPCPLCFLPEFRPGPLFLVVTKQFILQYVIVKPVMAVISVILHFTGIYHEGSFSPSSGYFYVTIFTNLSVTFSMYFLVLFYLVMERELAPSKPIAKFICIKAILFFSFWQSVLFGILSYFDVIPEVGTWKKEEVATGLQDFVICIEMFILSVTHAFVFPYQPYRDHNLWISLRSEPLAAIRGSAQNFSVVVDQKDLISDIKSVYNLEHIKKANKQQKELVSEENEFAL